MKNFQNKEQIVKISNVIRHVLFAVLVLWIGVGIPIILAQAVNSRDVFGCMAKLYLHGGAILFLILSFLVNLMLFRFLTCSRRGTRSTRKLSAIWIRPANGGLLSGFLKCFIMRSDVIAGSDAGFSKFQMF